jgi:hypothetical protein
LALRCRFAAYTTLPVTAPGLRFSPASALKIDIEFRTGEDLNKELQKEKKDFSSLMRELNL